MSFSPTTKSMCRQFVTIEAYAGDDAHGATVYSTGNVYTARVVNKSQTVVSRDGGEVASRTTVYLADDLQVDPRSRITLPASAVYTGGSTQPAIIDVAYYPDATTGRMSHTKIFL